MKSKRNYYPQGLFFIFLFVCIVRNAVKYVDQDSVTGNAPMCEEAAPCGLEEGISSADDNDVVLLLANVYASCNLALTKSITISGVDRETVVLTDDISFTSDSGISLSMDSLTIQTVTGVFLSFGSTFSENVELNNLRFKDLSNSAITCPNCGSIQLTNVTFEDSVSSGLVNVDSTSTLEITNCTFDTITGTAIDVSLVTSATIYGTSFLGFEDASSSTIVSSSSELVIEECIFDRHYGGVSGGAVYFDAGTLRVKFSYFSQCEVTSSGGCIFANNAIVTIIGSTFDECQAANSDSSGGGIHVSGGSGILVVRKTDISNAEAGYGGGVYVSSKGADLDEVNFMNCVAVEQGGGFFAGGATTVSECTFTGCQAKEGGGYRSHTNGATAIENSRFENCKAEHGGGVYSVEEITVISYSEFYDCSGTQRGVILRTVADLDGGGTLFDQGEWGGVTIDHCTYINCRAEMGVGGGHASLWLRGSTRIYDSVFDGCFAQDGASAFALGRADFLHEGLFFAERSDFLNSHSNGRGGSVSCRRELWGVLNQFSTYLTDCNFYNSSSFADGGAVSSWGQVDIRGSNFDGCSSGTGGGCVVGDLYTGNGVFFDNTFKNGYSEQNGGCISLCYGNMYYIGNTFENCVAEMNGGAIYQNDLNEVSPTYIDYLEDNTFESCESTEDSGGALYYFRRAARVFDQVTFRDCKARKKGGALYSEDGNGHFYIQDSDVLDCSAEYGGGMYIEEHHSSMTDVFLTDVDCSGNTALENGGCLSISGAESNFYATDSTFRNNECTAEDCTGGALHVGVIRDSVELLRSEFISNNALYGGGGVFLEGSSSSWEVKELLVSESTFWGCTSSSRGGCIYTGASHVALEIDNCNISSCASGKGGGVYMDRGKEFTSNGGTVFQGNEASSEGGALFCDTLEGESSITETLFSENYAAGGGASIYGLFYEDLTITDTQFVRNYGVCSSLELGVDVHAYSSTIGVDQPGDMIFRSNVIEISDDFDDDEDVECPLFYFGTWYEGDIMYIDFTNTESQSAFSLSDIHMFTMSECNFTQTSLDHPSVYYTTTSSFEEEYPTNAVFNQINFYDWNVLYNEDYDTSSIEYLEKGEKYLDIFASDFEVLNCEFHNKGILPGGGNGHIHDNTFHTKCRTYFTQSLDKLTIEQNTFQDCSGKMVDIIEDTSSYTTFFKDGFIWRDNQMVNYEIVKGHGTVFKFGGNGDFTISDLSFLSNLVLNEVSDQEEEYYLVWIYNVGGLAKVTASDFFNITLHDDDSHVLRMGSVESSNSFLVENCSFTSINIMEDTRGSGAVLGDLVFSEEQSTDSTEIESKNYKFKNCKFQNISKPDGAGGAYTNYYGSVEFSGCWFEDNAGYMGGHIFSDGGVISLTGYTILRTSQTSEKLETGAVHIRRGKFEMEDTASISDADSSCVFVFDGNVLIHPGATFSNCHSPFYGGGVSFLGISDEYDYTPRFSGNYFDCSSELGGGGLSIRYVTVSDDESTSQPSHEFLVGSVDDDVDHKMRGCFANNGYGGAVYIDNVHFLVTSFDCDNTTSYKYEVEDCSTESFGGGLYSTQSSVRFDTSCGESALSFDFNLNHADGAGGAYFDLGVQRTKIESFLEDEESLAYSWNCVEEGDAGTFICFKDFHEQVNEDATVEFSSNTVSSGGYGSDFSSPPVYLNLRSYVIVDGKDASEDERTVSPGEYLSVQSGTRFDVILEVRDSSGTLVTDYREILVKLGEGQMSSQAFFGTSTSENFVEGGALGLSFEGISFTRNGDEETVESSLQFYLAESGSTKPYSEYFEIPILVEYCGTGYVRLFIDEQDDEDEGELSDEFYTCSACPSGRYSIREQADTCYKCPNGVDCTDPSRMVISENYWAYVDDDEAGSVSVLFCVNGKCEGGEMTNSVSWNNTCGGSFDPDSVMCGSCIENHSLWSGSCIECQGVSIVSIIIIFVILSYSAFTIHKNSQSTESTIERMYAFFGQTYRFILQSVDWGQVSAMFVPLLTFVTSFQLPALDDELDSSTSFVDYVFYPFTYLMSNVFSCPFSRSSYFVIWSGYLEILAMFGAFFVLFMISCVCIWGCRSCCFACVYGPKIKKGVDKIRKKKEEEEKGEGEITGEEEKDKVGDVVDPAGKEVEVGKPEDAGESESSGEGSESESDSEESDEEERARLEKIRKLKEEIVRREKIKKLKEMIRKREKIKQLKEEIRRRKELIEKRNAAQEDSDDDEEDTGEDSDDEEESSSTGDDDEEEEDEGGASTSGGEEEKSEEEDQNETDSEVESGGEDESSEEDWELDERKSQILLKKREILDLLVEEAEDEKDRLDEMVEDDPWGWWNHIFKEELKIRKSMKWTQLDKFWRKAVGCWCYFCCCYPCVCRILGFGLETTISVVLPEENEDDEEEGEGEEEEEIEGEKELPKKDEEKEKEGDQAPVQPIEEEEMKIEVEFEGEEESAKEEEEESGEEESLLEEYDVILETYDLEERWRAKKMSLKKLKRERYAVKKLLGETKPLGHKILFCFCFLPIFCCIRIPKKLFFDFQPYRRTLLGLTIVTYQLILENCLGVINCMRYGGDYVNMNYTDIKCFDTSYWAQFTFIFLIPIIYSLLFPILMFVFLFINKRKLYQKKKEGEDYSFDDKYGILYLCYRKSCWWYESVSTIRKIVIVLLMTMWASYPMVSDFCLCSALLIFIGIHMVIQPYRSLFNNFLEGCVLVCLFILQIIRTTSFSGRYVEVALFFVLFSFIPVFSLLTYLKYRTPLVFTLKYLERIIVRTCCVTAFLFCFAPIIKFIWFCFCCYCTSGDDVYDEENVSLLYGWRKKKNKRLFVDAEVGEDSIEAFGGDVELKKRWNRFITGDTKETLMQPGNGDDNNIEVELEDLEQEEERDGSSLDN